MIKIILATSEKELNEKYSAFTEGIEVLNKWFTITNNGAYCLAIEYKEVSNARTNDSRPIRKTKRNTGN